MSIEDTPLTGGEQGAPVEARPAFNAPSSWAKEDQDAFGGWPDDIKGIVSKRETEREKAINEAMQSKSVLEKQLGEWNGLFQPYMSHFSSMGATPHQVVKTLLQYYGALNQDPKGVISGLAKQYGVPFGEAQEEQEASLPQDPRIDKLMQGYQQITSQLSQQQKSQYDQVMAQIMGWIDEKGQDGKPLRPYMNQMQDAFVPLVQSLRGKNPHMGIPDILGQVYDQLQWTIPEAREALMKAVKPPHSVEGGEEELKKRALAEDLSGGNSKGKGSNAQEALSIRKSIEKAIKQHG